MFLRFVFLLITRIARLRLSRREEACRYNPALGITLVSPARVLGGEPLDQHGDLGADRRPSHPVRMGPLAGDQTAVPAEDGAGGDQPVRSQLCRQGAGSAR